MKNIEKFILLAFFSILAIAVFALTTHFTKQDPVVVSDVFQLPNKNNIFLLDRFNQHIIAYNTETFRSTKLVNNINYFQYSSELKNDYLTSGDSITRGFEILYKSQSKISHIYTDNNSNEALFPLVTQGDKKLFIKTIYNDQASTLTSSINLFTDKNVLVEFPNTKGNVEKGVLQGNTLFYSGYVEKDDTYSLFKLDITSLENKPELIRKGLISGDIYLYQGELYTSSKDSISNGKISYPRKFLNYFDDKSNLLIQIDVNSQAGLEMTITSIKTKALIATIANPIDFEIFDGKVVVYCEGKIQEVKIN